MIGGEMKRTNQRAKSMHSQAEREKRVCTPPANDWEI